MIITEQKLLILGIITFLILFVFLLKRRLFLKAIKEFVDYRYELISPSRKTLKKKTQDSEDDLINISKVYENSDIDHIILIHGTFAGDDPLMLSRGLLKQTPRILLPLHNIFRKIMKKSFDVIGKDLGNFTKHHKIILEKYFKQKISLFNWSGSNSHYGRYHGAVELIEYLHRQKSKNFLIISHSHGGQLLALMTQLFWDESIKTELLKDNSITQETISQINKVRSLKFNLITMGTPVRYKWISTANINILHFINHRGKLPLGGSLIGGLWNRKGDYIQQFGGAGSDNFQVLDIHSKTNRKLAKIFKEDDLGLLKLIKRRQKLHGQGLNLLVNYRDAKIFPNFFNSMFGHGIYTRYHLLAFHLEQISKHLI